MIHPIAITAVLAAESSTRTSASPRAEVTHGPDWATVLTYDSAGEVTAEIVVWTAGGEIRVDAAFPDGSFINSTTVDGELVAVDCEDCESVRAQIAAVMDDMPGTDYQEGGAAAPSMERSQCSSSHTRIRSPSPQQ